MLFKHKDSIHIRRFKKIAEAMAVGTGIILFWRGIWALADTYLYPENAGISATISLFSGILILLLTRSFVKQFLGELQDREIRAEKSMFEQLLNT
jgi:Fuseless